MAASEAASVPLSLKPWPAQEEEAEPLEELIRRIHVQRGHFRNVTEPELEEEIRKEEARKPEDESDDESNENQDATNDVDARKKELGAAKAEMVKLLGQAHNEALTALDFISLLASREAPQRSESSISPALKQMTPSGTLGYDRTETSKRSKQEEEQDKAVMLGWNIKDVDTTADALLDKARRMEEEMEKEARYWEEVLSVKENGCSVGRLPQERHTIGVRFGFSEAGPAFYNQGLAALRPSADGSIVLDRGLSRSPKAIRVRVRYPDGRSETSGLHLPPVDTKHSVGTFIYQARDSLFEEELFHEMTREARSLQSYGIKIAGDVIHLPTNTNTVDNDSDSIQTLIDLVSPEELDTSTSNGSTSMADAIAFSFRLLLCHVYRTKFKQRSRPPAPLSADKPPPEIYQIVRPVLSQLQHHTSVQYLDTFLRSLTASFLSAKFETTLATTSNTLTTPSLSSKQSLLESLSRIINKPISTTHTLKLSTSTTLTITTTTHFSAPTYGTTYTLKSTTSHSDRHIGPAFNLTAPFTNAQELQDHIQYMAQCEIIATIGEVSELGWRRTDSGNELRKIIDVKRLQDEGADNAEGGDGLELDGAKSRKEEWRLVVRAKDGKLLLAGGSVTGVVRLSKIWLWDGQQERQGEKHDGQSSVLEVARAYTRKLDSMT